MTNTIWARVWPEELSVHQQNPRAFPVSFEQYPFECANCGGMRLMAVYILGEGPLKYPDGRKLKWFDLSPTPPDPRTPSVSGWYMYRLETSPCPVCQQGRREAYLIKNCGLTGNDLFKSLEGFRVSGSYAEKSAARNTAASLLALNHHPAGFVTFTGEYGVGKSHLLMSIVNGFRVIGIQSRYSTLADLLADIRELFGEPNGGRQVEEIISDIRHARVLCIDEVDRVNLTGWAKETIFRLVESRSNERDDLLTVMATNTSPSQFPPELGYLASRMSAGLIVPVGGPDVRPALGLKAQKEFAASAQLGV